MTAVFADTFYFLALLNPRDRQHVAAVDFSRTANATLLTTQWVLAEVGNALARGANRVLFARLLDELIRSSANEIVPADEASFQKGVELYRRRGDEFWSLTDCISFVVMEERGIHEALTADHHFEQAGYVALLK